MDPKELINAPLVFGLAVLIGLAINRGSICTVSATDEWIVHGRTSRIRAFVVAGASSGLVILPLAWLWAEQFKLALAYPLTPQAAAAGALFGIGARINQACAFGTLAHLTGGHYAFAFTVAAMALGGFAGDRVFEHNASAMTSPIADVGIAGLLSWLACLALAIPALRTRHLDNLRKTLLSGKTRLRAMSAMLMIGVGGGLLYSLAGDWTYLSIMRKDAIPGVGSGSSEILAFLGGTAMIAGGILGAFRNRRFRLRGGSLATKLRCFVGGFLMGLAASTIPGGNSSLLVFSIPSLAPHAVLAYAAMMAVLALTFVPARLRKRAARRSRPPGHNAEF